MKSKSLNVLVALFVCLAAASCASSNNKFDYYLERAAVSSQANMRFVAGIGNQMIRGSDQETRACLQALLQDEKAHFFVTVGTDLKAKDIWWYPESKPAQCLAAYFLKGNFYPEYLEAPSEDVFIQYVLEKPIEEADEELPRTNI